VNTRRTPPGIDRVTVTTADGERTCLVHRPSGWGGRAPLPLVLMFHGGGGRAVNAMAATGWNDLADRERFLVAYPEGMRPDPARPAKLRENPQTWNDGSGRRNIFAIRAGIDDVGYVRVLLDELSRRYRIDERRIYATGFSNGASLVFHLARELGDRLAAVAPVAGCDWQREPPSGPLPSVLYITGALDPLNPLEGGEIRLGEFTFGVQPPLATVWRMWARALGCAAEPVVERPWPRVVRRRWSGCADGRRCEALVVEDLGHVWPGGVNLLPEEVSGPASDALEGTGVIWGFFRGSS